VILRRALGFLLGLVARAWLATAPLTLRVDPALRWDEERPWVLVFWHGQQLVLLRWSLRRRTVALVSRSRDGELQAGALPVMGVRVARGSSSRGGLSALRAIVRRLRGGLDGAFAVDGPRGPRGVVRAEGGRAGAALAARLAGGVVVPMAAACARSRVLRRSWDHFELPLPFARIVVAVGPPIEPDEATPEAIARAIDRACTEARTAVELRSEEPRGRRSPR
jgi:lysophospholipid acyltransferase (LPLAT)-like uncharacterized protein